MPIFVDLLASSGPRPRWMPPRRNRFGEQGAVTVPKSSYTPPIHRGGVRTFPNDRRPSESVTETELPRLPWKKKNPPSGENSISDSDAEIEKRIANAKKVAEQQNAGTYAETQQLKAEAKQQEAAIAQLKAAITAGRHPAGRHPANEGQQASPASISEIVGTGSPATGKKIMVGLLLIAVALVMFYPMIAQQLKG